MQKIKDFVKANKKMVAAIIVALLGLVGVTLQPGTIDDIENAVIGPSSP